MNILSDDIAKKNAKKKPLDFAKYRVGKEYNLPMDAQEYVRALRDVDDFVERKKSTLCKSCRTKRIIFFHVHES